MNTLIELVHCFSLLNKFFKGDEELTVYWMNSPSDSLGGLSPSDAVIQGRGSEVIQLIEAMVKP